MGTPEPIEDLDLPPAPPPIPDREARWVRCVYCHHQGAVRFEWREELVPREVGTFTLAGTTPKAVARMVPWPWAVCRRELGGCGRQSRGRVVA